jgi:hypothetical protein
VDEFHGWIESVFSGAPSGVYFHVWQYIRAEVLVVLSIELIATTVEA